MALQLRQKTHESIVYIDKDSAPRIIPFGEDYILEKLPEGTRVIYPNRTIKGLPNREAAVRYAINRPLESKPLYALLEPGMRVTVALDSINSPVIQMSSPDIRETILKVILEMCRANGIDDVHLIVANGMNKKLDNAEMMHIAGSEIFRSFYPDRFYCHDGEDNNKLVEIGENNSGLKLNSRIIESDLVITVAVQAVTGEGGYDTLVKGLTDYETSRVLFDPQSGSDQQGGSANKSNEFGEFLEKNLKIFHIEAVLNNRVFGENYAFLAQNEDQMPFAGRVKWEALSRTFSNLPRSARRKMMASVHSAYEMIGCFAGNTLESHKKATELSSRQNEIPVSGQCDILITGIGRASDFNSNSAMNPLLVQTAAMAGIFNMFRGRPLIKKDGVMVISHPCFDEFDHGEHPSYIEFFQRLLPETRDAFFLREKYEREFAANPAYTELYRRGNAYHGAHPFFTWYMSEAGRRHIGKVIVAGAENAHVPEILGWERADNLTEAISMARSFTGPDPEITMLHNPANMVCNVGE